MIRGLFKLSFCLQERNLNGMEKKELIDDMAIRFSKCEKAFICTEALKIFHKTESDEIALEALNLMLHAVQSF